MSFQCRTFAVEYRFANSPREIIETIPESHFRIVDPMFDVLGENVLQSILNFAVIVDQRRIIFNDMVENGGEYFFFSE